MTDTLGCAVVGLGWLGSIRAEIIGRLPGLRLVTCCDISSSAVARCPTGASFTTDLEDVVRSPEVEAVIVATPDGAHREPVLAALGAGKHVFCEKPLATSLDDADAILAAAETEGVVLAVGQTLRADGRYAAAKEKVAAGELGQPLHCSARRNWPAAEGRRMSAGTNLPLYLSVHDFDALQWILDSPIVRVSGEASEQSVEGIAGAPVAVATLRFANGVVGMHEVSWDLPDRAGLAFGDCGLTVVGSDGYLTVDASWQGVTMYGGRTPSPVPELSDKGLVEFPDYPPFDVGLASDFFAIELAAFADAVQGRRRPIANGADGRSAVAAALAFERSLATGQPVTVDLDVPVTVEG